jgi:hypothetical protein
VTESGLKRDLRDAPIPEEREAAERGWRVVRGAFEERRPARPPTRGPSRIAVVIGVAILALVLVLTPAGARVADLVHDVVEPGKENARPALTSLPAEGSLLVTSSQGPWVVAEDGSKRLLGAYEDATWSPSGLYVAVTDGHELTAVEPDGTVRWSLAGERPVSDPAWSPSASRIAYLSGASLRVVAGDGTDDRALVDRVARVTPAWRPLQQPLPAGQFTDAPGTNVLAYVDRRDRVTVHDVDGKVLWRTRRYVSPIRALEWSADRSRLLVRTAAFVDFLDAQGRRTGSLAAPSIGASMSPDGSQVAFIRRTESGESRLLITGRDGGGAARSLFSGPGRIRAPTWSPDGKWLLVAWRDADQWLFITPANPRQLEAVGQISRQFDPGATGRPSFPRISGWCCSR